MNWINIQYDRAKTEEAKSRIGKYKEISLLYRRDFAPSSRIGNCTNLFRKLLPKNEEDFCEKYFDYAEKHPIYPIKERGLSKREFCLLAKEYKKASELVLTEAALLFMEEDYLNDLLCHVITETYDGKKQELAFMGYLKSLGYDVSYFEGGIDAKYGVDIKIEKDRKAMAVQIKPFSFFVSKREDVFRDRVLMVEKYYHCLKDCGLTTCYAVYAKDNETKEVKWLKNNNGYKFLLDELFSFDHNNIAKTLRLKELPNNFTNLRP